MNMFKLVVTGVIFIDFSFIFRPSYSNDDTQLVSLFLYRYYIHCAAGMQ